MLRSPESYLDRSRWRLSWDMLTDEDRVDVIDLMGDRFTLWELEQFHYTMNGEFPDKAWIPSERVH